MSGAIKFLKMVILIVGGGSKRGHFSRLAGPIGANHKQAIRSKNSII